MKHGLTWRLAVELAACFALVSSLLPVSSAWAAPAAELVHFPSLDHWQGAQALTLDGYLFKPAGSAESGESDESGNASGANANDKAGKPYPVIVMFHGCAGALSKSGKITQRFRDMAQLLQQMGYGVLLVDSFNPRGTREICTTPVAQRTIFEQQRWLDAFGALSYLQQRSDVQADKIGAIGFSHGGSNAVAVMDANLPPYRASGHGFVASVAMYPGCYEILRQQPAFRAYGPLLIQSGELDDWTPAKYCRQLSQRSRDHGEPVEFISYADAYHDFDADTPVHERHDVRHGVHLGGNPAAREQAYARIREFFMAHMHP